MKQNKGVSVKISANHYRKLKKLSSTDGRSIIFMIGLAVDLFLSKSVRKRIR